MADCLSRDSLRAYLTDSLGVDEKTAVVAHLVSCEKCQDYLNLEADDSGFRRQYLDDFRAQQFEPGLSEGIDAGISTAQEDGLGGPALLSGRPDYFGRYRVEQLLGKGGIGEVWRAFDPKLQRWVAIKTRRRDRVGGGRFLEEAQALASLNYEGIVQVYDFGERGNQVFIVTELLPGGTLQERLQLSPLAIRDSVKLLVKVARAVQAAHEKGFIHRDIKPSNIILDDSGKPRLSDFGLAVPLSELAQFPAAREGTLPYMSPEQATGLQAVGFGSDIYSLGVVFYQLLTGTVPHHGATTEEFRELIQTCPPVPLRTLNSDVPERLEDICLKCLQKTPDDRYASAAAVADELEEWLTLSEPVHAETPDQFGGAAGQGNVFGRRLFLSALGIGGLSAALGIIFWPGGRRVRVVTKPAGARIVVYPIDPSSGLPDGKGRVEAWSRSPAEIRLQPGFYLVVAALDDQRFHEVFRTVPATLSELPSEKRHLTYTLRGNVIEWFEIEIPQHLSNDSLGYFTGSPSFSMGLKNSDEAPQHQRKLPPFYLEPREATLADCRALYQGQLLPGIAGRNDLPPDHFPMAHVWWDDAVGFAEKKGMRLPSEGEFEFAATDGGTRPFPWGQSPQSISEWQFGPAGQPDFDQVGAVNPVYGLYSNVPEWTATPSCYYPREWNEQNRPAGASDEFIVRGAPPSVLQGQPVAAEFGIGPRVRISQHRKSPSPIGFRCARSARPRLNADDLEIVVGESPGPRRSL